MAMPFALGLPTVRLTVRHLKVAAGLLAVGITVAATGGSIVRSSDNTAPAGGTLASAPAALQSAVSAALGAHASKYFVTNAGGTLAARGGGLSTVFTAAGPRVQVGTAELGLSFSGIGYGTRLAQPGHATPSATANKVSYRHAGVTEWYSNGPFGLEQGFTLQARPAGSTASGPLTIALRTSGAALSQHGSLIRISGGGTYSGLTAFDAAGRKLSSTLVLQHGTVLLRVKDAGARYPLTIDPVIGYGRMDAIGDNGSVGPVGAGAEGMSVSLSADGTEALVGAPADDGGKGAAWVFMLTGNGAWNYGNKLTPTGETGAGAFGSSVSLSSDGTRALVGAPSDANVGAAWSFTVVVDNTTDPVNPTSTATQEHMFTGAGQDNTNTTLGTPPGARYGTAVALSGDGLTALIGATKNYVTPPGINPGSVWAYTFTPGTPGTWAQQGSKFAALGGTAAFLLFGNSIALSDDGNTAVIGGPADGNGPGAAWIFTRSGTTWSQQGAKLTANDESGSGHFGVSVALASDGNTALIGGPNDNTNTGAAWVFVRSGTTWSQQGSKLVGDAEDGAAQFGTSVALSANGNTALVGGPVDESSTGAAWLYVRSSGVWAEQGTKLSGSGFGVGSATTQTTGTSVALSDDGLTMALGSPADENGSGSVYAFHVTSPGIPDAPIANAYDSGAEVQIDSTDSVFTSYTVTASPGGATVTGGADALNSTWLDVMGLTNGVEYTFTVTATNQVGTSVASAPSNAVTPFAAPVVEPTPEPTPEPVATTPAPPVTPPVVTIPVAPPVTPPAAPPTKVVSNKPTTVSTPNMRAPQIVVTGSGADHITTGSGADHVSSGAGADKIKTGAGNDVVNAGAGNDHINTGSGHNIVNAGSGNDTIVALGIHDVVNCGSGYDLVTANATTQVKHCEKVTVQNASGQTIAKTNPVAAPSFFPPVTNKPTTLYAPTPAPKTVVTGSGADKITTGSGADKIKTGAGNDVVNAGAGNDHINTGSGHNIVNAGSGKDEIVALGNHDVVNCGPGNDTVTANASATVKGCEHVILPDPQAVKDQIIAKTNLVTADKKEIADLEAALAKAKANVKTAQGKLLDEAKRSVTRNTIDLERHKEQLAIDQANLARLQALVTATK